MKKELLLDYVACGREIEFTFDGKMYSITYSPDARDYFISFCEFYCEPTNVKTPEELLAITRDANTVLQMWESLEEDAVWVF